MFLPFVRRVVHEDVDGEQGHHELFDLVWVPPFFVRALWSPLLVFRLLYFKGHCDWVVLGVIRSSGLPRARCVGSHLWAPTSVAKTLTDSVAQFGIVCKRTLQTRKR